MFVVMCRQQRVANQPVPQTDARHWEVWWYGAAQNLRHSPDDIDERRFEIQFKAEVSLGLRSSRVPLRVRVGRLKTVGQGLRVRGNRYAED
jgi:hypothetical protein